MSRADTKSRDAAVVRPFDREDAGRRHHAFGWSSLTAFMLLGLVLETLHGFKVGFYLDVGNETRRLMWSLAHAHGTLISLIHLAFAGHQSRLQLSPRERLLASRALFGATALLPGGFFLGGFFLRGADPGVGVVVAPVGALLLIGAAALCAKSAFRS